MKDLINKSNNVNYDEQVKNIFKNNKNSNTCLKNK